MRLGITGSRHGFTPRQRQHFIDLAYSMSGITEFHHGDCKGVDEQSVWILAERRGFGVFHAHPATLYEEWDAKWCACTAEADELGTVLHPGLHPLERNKVIVASVDLLLAYPRVDSRGTYHTIRHARNRGVAVIEVQP